MKDNEKIHLEIEAFLQNEMSASDRLLFEKRLENDSELKNELNLHRSLNNTLNKKRSTSIKKDLNNAIFKETKALLKGNEFQKISKNIEETGTQYFEEIHHKKTVKNRFYFMATAAAAIFLVLIGISTFLKSSNIDIYTEYQNWDTLPSLIEKNEDNTVRIETYYKTKKYDKIIYLLSSKKLNTYEFVYLGASYFQQKEYKKSIEVFDELIASNSIDNTKGYWYKMLIYLNQKDLKMTKDLLVTITQDEQNYNYKEAVEIIEKLDF